MKSKIHILPEELCNKIAAGEIIERPGSVVKELVENSIDAGSTRIAVDIRESGRKLIRVTDDGEGMGSEDVSRSFERHATSKLRQESDLQRIRTMGFRGEALPSIGSIARVLLTSAEKGAVTGTRVVVSGGVLEETREAPAAQGTVVEVEELFYNTPARRKFLKSNATEFSHIFQAVQREAYAHPWIHFSLTHNAKPVFDYPAVRSEAERIGQILGPENHGENGNSLLELKAEQEGIRIQGWISPPGAPRKAREKQEFFLNRRWIKNPALTHAVRSAYETLIGRGSQPSAILFIEINPERVDVNVHPAKREVRFRDSGEIHRFVQGVLKDRLLKEGFKAVSTSFETKGRGNGGVSDGEKQFTGARGTGLGSQARTPPFSSISPGVLGEALEVYRPGSGKETTQTDFPGYGRGESAATEEGSPAPLFQSLGQVDRTFLVALVDSELHLLDQHAAHERLIFERLVEQFQGERIEVQPLLIPQTLEVSVPEAAGIREILPGLLKVGIGIEEFGEKSFRVTALPVLLGPVDAAGLINGLLEDVSEAGHPSGEKLFQDILASMACQAAVKANQKLGEAQIRGLLEDLYRKEIAPTCPHGRPIRVRFGRTDLERMFHRR